MQGWGLSTVLFPISIFHFPAGGRPLIPKTSLGGPSLRACFMQGAVFLLSFFQFLFSIFWQLRAEFSSCKALESAEALGQFDSGQAVLAIEPAKEVRRGMRALPGGWPPLNSENVFGWPILAGLFHARAGGAPFGI